MLGIVEQVQIIISKSKKRHALVTFRDSESATRALNGTSKLPIRPMTRVWFLRYEPPAHYMQRILGWASNNRTRSHRPDSTGDHDDHDHDVAPTMESEHSSECSSDSMPSDEETRLEPGSSKLELFSNGDTTFSWGYVNALKRRSHELERQLLPLQDGTKSLLNNLGEAYKSVVLLKERLAQSEKLLAEERERHSRAEANLRRAVEEQNRVIEELRNGSSSQPHIVHRADIEIELNIDLAGSQDMKHTDQETVLHEKLEDCAIQKGHTNGQISETYISAVGPSILEAFRLLDQIISNHVTKEAFKDGPEGPMRKKRDRKSVV